MTTTTTLDRSKRGNGGKRGKTLGPVLVSGNRLAVHFGVVRQHVDQLAAQGVIERRPDGLFDQDVSRLKYLEHLRSQHRRSPRAEADGELARARAEWLRLRSVERLGELVSAETFNEAIEELAGLTLTAMASIPARLYPYAQDLAERRRCEGIIRQVRQELATKALHRAGTLRAAIDNEATHDADGEPVVSGASKLSQASPALPRHRADP